MRVAAIGLGLMTTALTAVGLAQPGPGLVPTDPIGMGGEQIIDLRLVGRELPIPRNGSLLFFARFDGIPESHRTPLVQVSRMTAAGTVTFGGELRELGSFYYSWTAVEPLEVGTYQLSVAHGVFGTVLETVTVVDDVALEPPAFTANPIVGYASTVTEYAACNDRMANLLQGSPFPTREKVHALVFANLTLSGEPMNNHQFLYRAVAPGLEAMALSASNAAVVAEPFMELAQEYCFGIEAVSITTGVAHPYPDIELCAPHGDVDDFAERDVSVPLGTFNRFVCMVPPAGFEESWCQANADCIEVLRFAERAQSDNCQTYYETCPDAARPDAGPDGTAMDAGAAGSAGADGRRDAGFEQEDAAVESDASDDKAAASTGSGCGVARQASALHASPVACAVLATLALLRVRRRGPARRAS